MTNRISFDGNHETIFLLSPPLGPDGRRGAIVSIPRDLTWPEWQRMTADMAQHVARPEGFDPIELGC